MKVIAEQPYVKVQQQIEVTGKHYVEEDRTLYLYSDRILSKYHEFPIEIVWDISYRPVGPRGGLLYLHTNRGVNVYTVKESPERFIEAFREIIK
ncbi:hypothetical protein [Lentibacillus amyloliquefaciens]|uniref:YokE-like PH domain-containing protein n=1 Tax=Lentibacillus amyloliquefaciens TaxID=1472767 RepID=A0A0U4F9T6_9BACI|nr:hypothetical protein [Lentibacillus amyloliquefaciens]ALX49571.1 hypothetical protein AOX59_13955 [Lentibacillus amyloliquefaciens]